MDDRIETVPTLVRLSVVAPCSARPIAIWSPRLDKSPTLISSSSMLTTAAATPTDARVRVLALSGRGE